jgi:predicted glycoside hydrolase/deacetylase ChbG (UPF0249 family)
MGDWKLKRYLIVNADDFGQSPGVNRGIIEAHERGIVTSASLMVRWAAARAAASYACRQRELSVGLHFDFAEWACENGNWRPLYEVVPQNDAPAVIKEADRQLAMFRKLVGRDPTHLDSHQHAHRKRSLRGFFEKMAAALGVPLRSCNRRVSYVGQFYGQSTDGHPATNLISAPSLIKLLEQLQPGFSELGCHPGYGSDLQSMYRHERAKEVVTLCNPRVRAFITEMGISLSSFHDFQQCSTDSD